MAIQASFQADFTNFQRAAQEAQAKLVTFESSAAKVTAALGRMETSLSGKKLIQDATLMAQAIENTGGVAKLTGDELQKFGAQAQAAADKLVKLGLEVPPGIQKIADAAVAAESKLAATTKAAGLLSGAFTQVFAAFSAASLVTKAVGAITDLGREALATAGTLVDLSNKTGLSTETIQRMQFVAKQSGTDMQTFADAAFKMGVNISEGTKKAREGAEALGLDWQKLRAASPDEQFNMVVKALEAMEDPQKRNTSAVALFGKTAKEILPAIVDGYTKVATEATVAGDAQVKALDAAGDAWDRFKTRITGGFIHAAGSLLLYQEAMKTLTDDEKKFAIQTAETGKSLQEILVAALLVKQKKDLPAPTPDKPSGSASFVAELEAATAGYKALTTSQLDNLAAAIQLGKGNEEIINDLNITEAVLSVAKKAFEEHKSALTKAAEEQQKYAAAVADYNSTAGPDYLSLLDAIGNELYEGVAFDKARGKSATELVVIYKTMPDVINRVFASEDAYKKKLSEVTAATDARRKVEIEINKIIAEQTLVVNKAVIAGLDARLKAQAAYNTEVARMTLSAVDFQKAEIEIQIKNQEALGSALVGQAKITSDLIVATLKLQLEQVDTVWKEHPMIPPKASFDTKTQVAGLSSAFDVLGQTIQGLSTISVGTFGHIIKDIGLANVAAQAFGKAVQLTMAGHGSTPDDPHNANVAGSGAGLAAAASTAAVATMTASTISIVGAWIAVGVAVAGFISELREAQKEAEKLQKVTDAAHHVAVGFQSATQFSDAFNQSLADTTENFKHITALNTKFSLDGEESVTLRTLAESAHLADIIKELGGVSALTATQVAMVHDRMYGLFTIIGLGGPVGQAAIKTMDDTLIAFTTDLVKSGGLVDQFFLDMAARAKANGVDLKQVSDFQAAQAKAAETGIVGALSITNDAWAKRKDLQGQVAQATTDLAGKSGSALVDQQAKLADLNAQLLTQQHIIDATGIHSQAAAGAVSGALLGVISSQVAAGTSFGDAIRSVAPGIDSLKNQLNAMGVGGGDAFDFLNQQVALFTGDVTGPALQSIEGYAQGLVGLHNAGQLNQDTFAGITEQIGKTEQALEAQGVSGPALLTAMQSPLQKIWELEEKFGYKADAATQALVDQALATGAVGQAHKSVSDQMLDATSRIARAVEGLARVFGVVLPEAAAEGADGITSALRDIKPPTITVPVHVPSIKDLIDLDGLNDPHERDVAATFNKTLIDGLGDLPSAAKDAATGISDELGKIKVPKITIPVVFLKGGETGADDYPYHIKKKPGDGGPQASGGDYMVTKPTLFLAGEAGAERATFTPISQKTQTSAGSATPAPNPPAGDTTYQISITGFNGTDILRTVRSSEFVQALVSATAQNKNGLGTGLKGALQVTP
jgi:hypothetical protein